MQKLSEAFLEFIQPLLKKLGDPAPRTIDHDAACALGHVVWNAVVMEELNPGKDYLTPAKAHGGTVREIDGLIDMMAGRKRQFFSKDNRLIGVYDVLQKPDGSFSLWAQIIDQNDIC